MEPRGVLAASDSVVPWRSGMAPKERRRRRPDAENDGAEVSFCSPSPKLRAATDIYIYCMMSAGALSPLRPLPVGERAAPRFQHQDKKWVRGFGSICTAGNPLTPSLSPKRGEGAHRACRTFIDTRFATRDAYSDLTAAALMIGVQRAISSLTSAARGCWPRRGFSGISLPSSSRRFCVAASSSALSSAALSASTIGLGVPLGANNAFQADARNCASPASVDVGSSGS